MSDKFTIEIDARTIYDSLKNMEAKMEEMIRHQKHTNGSVAGNMVGIKENSKRIGTLEKFKMKSTAFIAGVVAVVQIALNYLPPFNF